MHQLTQTQPQFSHEPDCAGSLNSAQTHNLFDKAVGGKRVVLVSVLMFLSMLCWTQVHK